jgi:hypothetical protein
MSFQISTNYFAIGCIRNPKLTIFHNKIKISCSNEYDKIELEYFPIDNIVDVLLKEILFIIK